jgi:hypothetical protein
MSVRLGTKKKMGSKEGHVGELWEDGKVVGTVKQFIPLIKVLTSLYPPYSGN